MSREIKEHGPVGARIREGGEKEMGAARESKRERERERGKRGEKREREREID